jgi:hypothetical protein
LALIDIRQNRMLGKIAHAFDFGIGEAKVDGS